MESSAFLEGLRTSCQSEGSAPKPRKRHPETCFCLMRRERAMLYNQELRDAGRAFNSKPFRTARRRNSTTRRSASMAVIDAHSSHISRQDRLASGRRRGRLLPHRHVRRRHGGAPAVRASSMRPSRTSSCIRWPRTPGSVESINNFIAEQCRQHPEFIGFMAIAPGLSRA